MKAGFLFSPLRPSTTLKEYGILLYLIKEKRATKTGMEVERLWRSVSKAQGAKEKERDEEVNEEEKRRG